MLENVGQPEQTADNTGQSENAPGDGVRRRLKAKDLAIAGLLLLCMVAYGLLLGGLSLSRHARYATTTFDLGIFDQATWLMSRGQPLFMTTRGLHPLGDHFSPILFFIALLYRFWANPECLLVVQTAALALGAVPAYLIAVRHVGSRLAAILFAVAYLAHPAIGWMNTFDFHPDALATTPMLWALWAVDARRPRALYAALCAMLLCKEVMGLVVIMVGLYAMRPLGRRVGLSVVVMGVLGLCGSMLTLRYFNGGQSSAYFSLYEQYGSSAPAIAVYLITHPIRLLTDLLTMQNITYLVQMAYPFLYLSLLAPRTMLVAVPTLLSNMLSSRSAMHELTFQYNAITTPIFMVAAVQGFAVVLRWLGSAGAVQYARAQQALTIGLLLCLTIAWQQGPITTDSDSSHLAGRLSMRQAAAIDKAISLVPLDAPVSAQTAIAGHMAHRHVIYMYPNPFWQVCWGNSALALRQQLGKDLGSEELSQALGRIHAVGDRIEYVLLASGSSKFPMENSYDLFARPMLFSPDYGVIWAQDDVVVLRHGADHAAGLALLRSESAACRDLVRILEGRTRF